MKSEFILTQGSGQKLEFAINRTEGDARDVEWLSTGNNFKMVRCLASGKYVLTSVAHAIKKLLEKMEPVTVMIDSTINFNETLQTCTATEGVEALYFDPSFTVIFEQTTGKVPTSITMKPYSLKNSADDRLIKDKLPKVHQIDQTEFVYMLATELSKVRSGKHSDVLMKGRKCIFYVAGLAVSVSWRLGDSKWLVFVRELSNYQWDVFGVVYTCN